MNHFCKEVPIIVVGCKTDLRKDRSLVKKLRKNKLEPVTYHRVGNPARGHGARTGNLWDVLTGAASQQGQEPSTLGVWSKVGVILEMVTGQELLVIEVLPRILWKVPTVEGRARGMHVR